MIHLRLRTEYSFGRAFGRVDDVLRVAGGTAAGITDSGTWGHVTFHKAATKLGIKPILGAECAVVLNPHVKEKQGMTFMAFLARNAAGLQEVYALTTRAHQQFYYIPRLGYSDINDVSGNVVILTGHGADMARITPRANVFLELNPSNPAWNRSVVRQYPMFERVVCADNLYPTTAQRSAYEILAFRERRSRTSLMHIPNEYELRNAIPDATDEDFLNTERIAASCDVYPMPRASMVTPVKTLSLFDMCLFGANDRGLTLGAEYSQRLNRELDLIAAKGFDDYFYVLADMVRFAKMQMLVGPARGSAAGSLVCYLLGITDVDPIQHGLMFERFIDINRSDLPDVDIDFQDTRRDLVIDYMRETYGRNRVGRIGTVARYKPKSAFGIVAKELKIPAWEIAKTKDNLIERAAGDVRASMCIADTFETFPPAAQLLEKYPQLQLATELEGHAQHTGKHAAGVIVAQSPVSYYCTVDKDGTVQLDKKDAEYLNMLKIDALGLRTLSVLQDTLEQIGRTREWLLSLSLDDKETFETINAERYAGIFQFEGSALQSLTRAMKVQTFDDMTALTALARPGPLGGGAAQDFVQRRIGKAPVTHMHPLMEAITRDTFGTIVYQEQVMAILRAVGAMEWPQVIEIRTAIGKSLGDEIFETHWQSFRAGAVGQGVSDVVARRIWDAMRTFGSYAFNKSHAVSYGLISYWCAYLKTHHPLQFAAGCLRNASDDEQSVKVLRDLVQEGFEYVPVDVERSDVTWTTDGTRLIGGLINVHGIGRKTAEDILARRAKNLPLTAGVQKKLATAKTPFDDVFPVTTRFAEIYKHPKAHRVLSGPVSQICDVREPGEYIFIGAMVERNPRDMNDATALAKRKGRVIKKQSVYLNVRFQDDTDTILARVSRFEYAKFGTLLTETHALGDYFLVKGRIQNEDWRTVDISAIRHLPDPLKTP